MENDILFFELSRDELTLLASLVALALSKRLDVDQINILGNFLAAVGTLMATIAAQEAVFIAQQEEAENENQANDVLRQIKELQEKVQQILEN